MKAGKKDSELIVIKGCIVHRHFGVGSKSEHNAVYIENENASYKLRRVHGNPFHDPELEKLVGKEVIATGVVKGYLFIATDIDEENPPKN